ncbi:MAG: epoxyqueuosine reductase QueH [Candidatus Moraniibacteriota bacterium]
MSSFLLRCCCAPCGIAVIDELRAAYALTVFFYNPNIDPEEEYQRRKREVVRVCEEWQVPMIDGDYEPAVWAAAIRGRETAPEGGLRCQSCIGLRLQRTAEEAHARGIEQFGTTLTMGRRKRADMVTPLGVAAGETAGVAYHVADWKKQGREAKARQMVAERGIYRQTYCGCRYSRERQFDLD